MLVLVVVGGGGYGSAGGSIKRELIYTRQISSLPTTYLSVRGLIVAKLSIGWRFDSCGMVIRLSLTPVSLILGASKLMLETFQ